MSSILNYFVRLLEFLIILNKYNLNKFCLSENFDSKLSYETSNINCTKLDQIGYEPRSQFALANWTFIFGNHLSRKLGIWMPSWEFGWELGINLNAILSLLIVHSTSIYSLSFWHHFSPHHSKTDAMVPISSNFQIQIQTSLSLTPLYSHSISINQSPFNYLAQHQTPTPSIFSYLLSPPTTYS